MDPVKGVPKPHFVNGWFQETFLGNVFFRWILFFLQEEGKVLKTHRIGKAETMWSWGMSWQESSEDGARRWDLVKPSGPPCLSGRWCGLETSPEELGTSLLRTSGAPTKSLGFMLQGWEPLEDFKLTTVAITADSLSTPYLAIWTA